MERPTRKRNRARLEHWQVISALLLVYDAICVNVAFLAALWLRFDCQFSAIPGEYLSAWKGFTLIYTAVCLLVFSLFRLYQSIWRFASFSEMQRLLTSNLICGVLHIVGITLLFQRMPISYYAMGIVLQILLVGAIRFAYRFVLLIRSWKKQKGQAFYRVMLIGAGEAGQMILRDLMKSTESKIK